MSRRLGFIAFVLISAQSLLAIEPQDQTTYRQLQGAAAAKSDGTPEAASASAGNSFDEPVDHNIFKDPPSAPPASVPTLRTSGDFVVGSPQDISEPKNPLPKDEKKKDDSGPGMGMGMRILGVLLGGLICGGLAFLLGGPIVGAIGFAAGAVGGWFATK